MFPAPFRVVLDANVLYPFSLRDTLLRAADAGLYQVYWSEKILEETLSNLVENNVMPVERATRLGLAMSNAFPEALVTGYEALISAMTNDPKDRHVNAAAVRCGAQVVVTMNLSDFQSMPDGIEAQSPDEFLCGLFDLAPAALLEIVRAQSTALRNPPVALDELLDGLSRSVPDFVRQVRAALDERA